MIRGLYAAASGMVAQMAQQDILANNLANVNTSGFRRQQPVVGAFTDILRLSGEEWGPLVPDGAVVPGAGVVEAVTDFSEGLTHETGNPLDLAISGEGFFVVKGSDGVERYTRDGHFTLNAAGELVTLTGEQVQGTGGAITVQAGQRLTVGRDGTVTAAGGGQALGQLRIVTLSAPDTVVRADGSRFEGTVADADTAKFTVRQGFVEESNVSAITEMTSMMRALRLYEASARAVQYQDKSLDTLISIVS